MPVNVMNDQGDIRIPEDAGEEEKDKVHNANAPQHYFSLDEVKSQFLEALPPVRRELLMARMQIRRGQLNDVLNSDNLSSSRRRMALRLLWFITGALDHKLSFSSLQEIYQTYKHLDLVPEGYMYAPLHMHREEPEHI